MSLHIVCSQQLEPLSVGRHNSKRSGGLVSALLRIFINIFIKGNEINIRVEPVPAKRDNGHWEAVFGEYRFAILSKILLAMKIEQKALLRLDVLL